MSHKVSHFLGENKDFWVKFAKIRGNQNSRQMAKIDEIRGKFAGFEKFRGNFADPRLCN